MLGNDLIDLRDLDARPETYRSGFDERVFSSEERREIACDRNPLARRWAHWGAKEAAYKLARQIDSAFVFSPRCLVADFDSEITKSIEQTERRGHLVLTGLRGGGDGSLLADSSFQADGSLQADGSSQADGSLQTDGSGQAGESIDLSLELRSFETAEHIHVVAVPAKTDWDGIDSAVSRMDGAPGDSSAAVRALAVREIGRRMGVAPDRISIGRRGRIPTVLLDGDLISLSLSLSHHGDWVGYATGLRVALAKRAPRGDGGNELPLAPLGPETPGASLEISKHAMRAQI